MMKLQLAVSVLASLACSACVSVASSSYSGTISHGTHLLSEEVTTEGETRSYVLHSDAGGSPTMNRTVARRFEIAVMGVNTSSIDGGLAKGLGVEPWTGVFVERVFEDSAAAACGMLEGDVLLKVGEQDITNHDQFKEYIAEELTAGQTTTVTISRVLPKQAREERTLSITLGAREVEEASTDTIALESPQGVEQRTGMQLVTVSGDLAKEIWDEDNPRVYVSGVVVGSPAYLAGIRRGDQLLSFGGSDVRSGAMVQSAVQGESRSHGFSVVGPQGAHQSTLTTVDALDNHSSFNFPILLGYSSRPHRTKVSFLDFIFQFGFNYDGWYYETDERQPAKKTNLSILPLGMFEFERSATKSKNTIFWLIDWTTRH